MSGPLVSGVPTSADGVWREAKFTRPGANNSNLKRGCNNSGHGLNAQTSGIPLSCGGRF